MNLDTVLFARYGVSQEEAARRVIETFQEFIRENRELEIAHLSKFVKP